MPHTTHTQRHTFRDIHCDDCGHVIQAPMWCGNRFCIFCSGTKLARAKHRIKGVIRKCEPPSSYRLCHVVLTIPTTDDLAGGVKHIIASFRRLRQTKAWKEHVFGGCWSLEVTYPHGKWHPHIHIICHTTYFDVMVIMKMWTKACKHNGDTDLRVWIKACKDDRAVNYLTNYITKTSIPLKQTQYLSEMLASCRLFSMFGNWRLPIYQVPQRKFTCIKCGGVKCTADHRTYHVYVPDVRMLSPPFDHALFEGLSPNNIQSLERLFVILHEHP